MFFIPKLRGGVSVVGIIMAIALPWFITHWPELVFDKQVETVPVPASMQACRSHEDCVFVETACSSCCRYEPINKSQVMVFSHNHYGPACASYNGAACDCVAGNFKPVCKKGRCLLEEMPVYNE